MSLETEKVKNIIEAALFSADKPLSLDQIAALFQLDELPERAEIKNVLEALKNDYSQRGIELKLVSSGYRFQVQQQYSEWISRLWEEKPPRYTRALLETLALVAYRQPITRAEIEDVRGVGVSTNIMKTLQERDWVKIVGHRDVPGRPALYATTRAFLDYFNMKSMDELPTLAEIKSLEQISKEFDEKDGSKEEEATTMEIVEATTTAAETTATDTTTDDIVITDDLSDEPESKESDSVADVTDNDSEQDSVDDEVQVDNEIDNEQLTESDASDQTDKITSLASTEHDEQEENTAIEMNLDADEQTENEEALDVDKKNKSLDFSSVTASATEGTLLN